MSDFLYPMARVWNAWRFRRAWRPVRSRDPLRLSYGQAVPARGECASGGIIKCQDLQAAFPPAERDANALYLVSSALPPFCDLMIRAAKRAGARMVLNQNGVAYPAWHGPGWERTNEALAIPHRHADFVIYQSRFCQLGAEKFLGGPVRRSCVLHNPVDTETFAPAPPPTGGPVLLCAGTHQRWAHLRGCLDAAALLADELPGLRVLVAGRFRWRTDEEEARAELVSHLERTGLRNRVDVLGPYPQTGAPALLHRAHILLHGKPNDACPRLVVEAMACGRPVVYSATGGVPELVGDDAGRGVPGPTDWEVERLPAPAALADGVRDVWRAYESFACAARERAVRHFDVRTWIDAHRDLFRQLLQENR